MGILLIAIEKITNLINRCEIYESLHVRNNPSPSKSQQGLAGALVELYAAILRFLIDAKNYLSKNTALRAMSGAGADGAFSLDEIEKAEKVVSIEFDLAEAESRRLVDKNRESALAKALRTLLDEIDVPLKAIGSDVEFIRSEMEGECVTASPMAGWFN